MAGQPWHVRQALDGGQRTVDEQRQTLDSLRSRSINLFGALSVAVGFLARRHGTDDWTGTWAVVAYCIAVVGLMATNWPVGMKGNLDPQTLLDSERRRVLRGVVDLSVVSLIPAPEGVTTMNLSTNARRWIVRLALLAGAGATFIATAAPLNSV